MTSESEEKEMAKLRQEETALRRLIQLEAKVTNFDKGYVSVPSVNQLINPRLQRWASDMIVHNLHDRDIHVDLVAGIPNSGISLASFVAESLEVCIAPGRKGAVPGGWGLPITIDGIPSFTTEVTSQMVFNGAREGHTLLLIDDFIAYGLTSVALINSFREKGVKVELATYVAKLFQGGVEKIKRETGVEAFYAIGIAAMCRDGRVELTEAHY